MKNLILYGKNTLKKASLELVSYKLLNFNLSGKKAVISMMAAGLITTGSLLDIVITKITNDLTNSQRPAITLAIIQENSLMAISNPSIKPVKRVNMILTAYSSTPEQTDDTPFITASGSRVRDGIIANNLLPFGTKVRIPQVFGDKIFEVEDRMNSRYDYNHLDVWFEDTQDAKEFGAKISQIEILEN